MQNKISVKIMNSLQSVFFSDKKPFILQEQRKNQQNNLSHSSQKMPFLFQKTMKLFPRDSTAFPFTNHGNIITNLISGI